MERVRLRVVLDEPDRVYLPKERVAGRVEVEVDDAVTSSALTCTLRWETAGDANSESGDSGERVLGSGDWKGGERLSFPFDLPLPHGPPTYDGVRFTVRWSVRAVAKLDWAFDPKADAPFRVGTPPGRDGSLVEKKETGGFELGCAVTCTLLMLLSVAVLLLSRRFAGIGWVGAALIGGVGALVMIPNAVARRRLGEVLLECGPSPVRAGEEFAVRILVHPKRRLVPESVRVVLVGVEKSVKGSGKHRKTRHEEFAKVEAALEGPEAVEGGKPGEWAGIVRVPADAPPSFEAGVHSVAWKAKFAIDQDWLPVAEWEADVVVVA